MSNIDRRDFLKILGIAGLSPMLSARSFAQDYQGELVISVNAFGAWDVSSFCDPKLNTPGELEINHWAQGMSEIPKAGNIPYAPVWGNTELFEKYHGYMLVINGVDAQTNSHTTGQIHAFSGRLSPGMPTYTSLVGAVHGRELPLSYLSFGGYSGTGGSVIATLMNNPGAISDLGSATQEWPGGPEIFPEEVSELIYNKRVARLDRLLEQPYILPKQNKSLLELRTTLDSMGEIKRFNEFSTENLAPIDGMELYESVKVAMIAYIVGLSISADFQLPWNYDTHSNHDNDHEPMMRGLNRNIDGIWELAEQLDIADRLTVIVNSEFSRTPFYNGSNGKDHWPIGSVIIMKKNAPWGNRVVGYTDELQNVSALNPDTLQVDEVNGKIIYPKDIHNAVRRLTGVADDPVVQKFNLNVDTEFDFFNPALSTPQLYS